MFGGNMTMWKLHTLEDYITFIGAILCGVVVFVLLTRRIKKNRNNDFARAKVLKQLRRLLKKQGTVYENITLRLDGQTVHFDGLLVDRRGVVLLRSYGWGTKVYGQLEAPTWKLVHDKESRTVENPLLVVEGLSEPLRRHFAAAGLHGVPLQPLAVFADPFDHAELYLGKTTRALPLAELKKWYKNRKLVRDMNADPKGVCALLETLFVDAPTELEATAEVK